MLIFKSNYIWAKCVFVIKEQVVHQDMSHSTAHVFAEEEWPCNRVLKRENRQEECWMRFGFLFVCLFVVFAWEDKGTVHLLPSSCLEHVSLVEQINGDGDGDGDGNLENYRASDSGIVFLVFSAQSGIVFTPLFYELSIFMLPSMLILSCIILLQDNKRPLPRFCV